MTLFEAARAHAAAAARTEVTIADLRMVTPLALRLRLSPFMLQYFQDQAKEEQHLTKVLNEIIPP
jgi:hypothetical protein